MGGTVGDFFWERLHAWGVKTVFGYPGDGINGLLGALNRTKGKVRFIQVRHEEMAAFMASAYAKFTGDIGVCLATSGPGASHLITGLYDARMDHMPVLAIAGQQARAAIGGHYQQELDLKSMFKDVAGAFVEQATLPSQVRHLVDRAIRIAKGDRRVTAIILPNDLQDLAYEDPPRKHGTLHSGIGYTAPKIVPYEADLQRAADVLNAGKKVAILVGAGALQATDEVIAVANKLGAGVAKALLGKAAVPDDLPWVTGSIGLLGTKPSWDMMTGCDTLLMIGSGFPYSEFLPKEGAARGVQIDLEPDMLSLRYPMEVNLAESRQPTVRADPVPQAEPKGDMLRPTIFVVDDESPVREAMRGLLQEEGWTVEVYSSGEAFLEAYRPGREGCLVVDARMPRMSGLELLERLKTAGGGPPAIMITGHADIRLAVRAMKTGAMAFLEKPVQYDELVVNIERALELTRNSAALSSLHEAAARRIAGLTSRERQVVEMVVDGNPNKQIAYVLGISQRTVETHRATAMKKIGARTLSELIHLTIAGTPHET